MSVNSKRHILTNSHKPPIAVVSFDELTPENGQVKSAADSNRTSSAHPHTLHLCGVKCAWKWILAWILLVLLLCTIIAVVALLLIFLPKSSTDVSRNTTTTTTILPLPDPLRLPLSLWPIHYNIILRTFLKADRMENLSFLGTVEILLECTENTDTLKFHALGLEFGVENVEVQHYLNYSRKNCTVRSVIFDNYTQMVTVVLWEELQRGNKYLLRISDFVGFIRLDAKGFYLSTYKNPQKQRRFLAATQFEVSEARRAFPCFDEPKFKANFTVTILRRMSMHSISNMQRINSINRGDGWFEDRFATTVKMSTYLVAFVVSDFHFKQIETKSGITIRAYSRPDAINQVDHVLYTSVKMVKYFEDYFDIPYALDKLDLIALPDFSHGAMENWGLVTFKETAMLYNPERDTRTQRQSVSMILGHEIAHQWFGNLVTMEWWDDLWLNEGFANYMGYVSAEAVDQDEPMEHVFILENTLQALRLDSMRATHPILTDVSHPDEIVQLFDAITYRKGSCLIRMMMQFLGERVLQHGLQIYLKNHAYSNTISQDLWNALDEAVSLKSTRERMNGMRVSTVMDSWIRLTGYPYVTISRYYDGSRKAMISQERFIMNTKNMSLSQEKWYIPFTYTDAESQNWDTPRMKWLYDEPVELSGMPSDDDLWVVGNVNYSGFYRVNYDETNWRSLTRQLRYNHRVFSAPQRAQILDDSFEFSSADLLDIQFALNATAYLSREEEYLPWTVAITNLRFIDNILQGTPDYELFQDFMRSQVRNIYIRLGWIERQSEDKLTTMLRSQILKVACYYGMPDCLNKIKRYFQIWMSTDDTNHVPKDLQLIVGCYGIQQGGNTEWEFVWQKYLDSPSNQYQLHYLRCLSCTRDNVLLNRLLYAALNASVIRSWHVPMLISSISESLAGREASWAFLRQHWKMFLRTLNEIAANLLSALQFFNEPFRIDELDQFMAINELGPTRRKFEEVREAIEENISWKNRNAKPVVLWLKNFMLNRLFEKL